MAAKHQIRAIKTAQSWLAKHRDFTDQAYRTLLRSVAGVESCTQLGNTGFEQVMAVMEAMGFQSHERGPRYWRDKADRDGDRAVWKIEAMCAEYGISAAGFVRRMTSGRTDRIADLDAREVWKIIEALKQMIERGGEESRPLRETQLEALDDVPF